MNYHRYRGPIGKILPFIVLMGVFFIHTSAMAGKGDKIIGKVQAKFSKLSTLSTHFEVSYETGGSDIVHQDAGTLFMDGGGRFRTETTDQTVVSDGESVWMYSVSEKQVIIRSLDVGAEDLLTPRRLLYEYPELYRVETVENEVYSGMSCFRLLMHPIQPTDPTRKLVVWIDEKEHFTRKFLIEDLADNITTFEFEAFSIGVNLPENIFQFTPPEGVEIIDMR